MKLFSKFILITILLLPLAASQDYGRLIITKTSHKSSLKSIKQKLDSIDIKMFIQKSDRYYKIFSQKFQDKESAIQALYRVKRDFPYARLIQHDNSDRTDSNLENTNNFFVALALGAHKITTNSDNATSSVSYSLEVGYNYSRHINTTLDYFNASTSDIDCNNLYTALNYNFSVSKNIDIYAGGLVGYSRLKLKNFSSSSASSAIILGIQTGILYNLNHNIGFYTAYQGISLGHKVDITQESTTSTVDFTLLHNLQIGIQYRF